MSRYSIAQIVENLKATEKQFSGAVTHPRDLWPASTCRKCGSTAWWNSGTEWHCCVCKMGLQEMVKKYGSRRTA